MAEDKRLTQRRNILAEIETTELGYLQDLEILVNVCPESFDATKISGV